MAGAQDSEWFSRYLNRIETDLKEIRLCIEKLPEILEEKYLPRKEFEAKFWPIQKLVFGVVGIILMIIFATLVKSIVTK